MRRSICYCDPSYALAGEEKTWKFIYTPSATLPKGTRLKFDLQSRGREIDWQIPSVNLKKAGGVIYALLDNGKILQATEVEAPDSFTPHYEFVLPNAIEAGEQFTIILGAKESEQGKKGQSTIRAQTTAQRRRPFLLYIDPSGKGHYGDPEVFTIDIRGNELANIRILTPSFVAKNKRFDVIVRFEDEFGNLTNNAPEDTLIELSHEHLRENLNWKLFVPETGFIALPNLYFNEAGIYTIQLVNSRTKQIFRSPPIKCFPENNKHLYWGLLHGESDRFDSTENIESCMRHFRDDKAFNFYGVSPFESQEETPNETWKLIVQNVAEFDEDERFTTLLGFQWEGENKEEGARLLVYTKENKPLLRKKDLKSNTLKKIYKSFSPKELISIPCFTMAKGFEYNFEDYDPDFERVVEIYNAWGSSEMTKKEGNPRPIHSPSSAGIQESAEGSIQKALQRNCRFGFVAGGLDDRGIYADLYESDQEQYSPGLTAIMAPTHSREALAEALYQRSCYATTGERMIVGLYLAGIPMGKEVSTADKPGLAVNRHLSGYVAGTTKLKKIEIIRNGKVLKTYEPNDYHFEFAYDDMTPLEKVCIDAKDKKLPFAYYYLRVTQEDGHMAWSSPIWVDYIPLSALPKTNKRQVPKAVAPKKLFIEDDFDEEDEDEDYDDYEDEE
ncbi:DUF3604 domain-containing protein [Candidatus Protochlamydia phocaeensis]|uniref:DUF3604 domain-containing protein n=1 Tax=Candidatus Protochlamydia phocaeensis TaxID=1414722 RepID=UPI000838F098|nr:DUF3604 domain-containing protein [Candidatus Protochlamydia phocaeensis]